MSEEEHRRYHLEVSLEGCGVEGCDFNKALGIYSFMSLLEELKSK